MAIEIVDFPRNGDFNHSYVSLPEGTRPGYVNSLLLKMAIEIVDFPIRNGDFNHSYGTVYQRVPSANLWKDGIVHHVYRHCHLSWLRVVIVVNNVFF